MFPLSERHNDAIEYAHNGAGMNYETMFRKVSGFSYKGGLWYQGESNCKRTETSRYGLLFTELLNSWRKAFQENLPFFTVQLAPYHDYRDEDDWAGIREQQLLSAKTNEKVYLITTGDCAEIENIHPHNKDVVAYRLYLAVKNILYGAEEEYCGPIPQSYVLSSDGLRIRFAHTAGGLLKKGPIKIEIGRENEEIVVKAEIEGEELIVKNVLLGDTVSMCYQNDEVVMLTGKSGLPSSPFRFTVPKTKFENLYSLK